MKCVSRPYISVRACSRKTQSGRVETACEPDAPYEKAKANAGTDFMPLFAETIRRNVDWMLIEAGIKQGLGHPFCLRN
jgi:hypothetical protein